MVPSLIINTYDRPDALTKVFEGVSNQTVAPKEIIVADDGSANPTAELIKKWQSKFGVPVRHVWQPHRGFRRTVILNKAVREARSEYVVFLDGDCVPERRFIEDHERLAEPGMWVQGRRCFVREGFVESFDPRTTSVRRWLLLGRIGGGIKGIRLPIPYCKRDQKHRGILGCNMGFWRRDLYAVNGFDEAFVGWGAEDSELGSRLYHLGCQRKFVRFQAIVFHLDHPPLPRDRFAKNSGRLAETIRARKIRCERGLVPP